MNSKEFLEEIYPDKPDDAYILLWKNKKSKWFKDIDQAAKFIDKDKEDIYYGVGLSPKNFGTGKRCKADQIYGIPGFYVDIDIGTGSKNYPPTVNDAIKLVKGNGLDPSMIVNSGYGLHVYWLFKEFWSFKDKKQRDYAANLNRRINQLAREEAVKSGWNIDNISDLARILRPVGSLNCKGDPKPVQIITNDGPRYEDPDYFDKILPPLEEYTVQPQEKISDKDLAKIKKLITLNKMAEAPPKKLDILTDSDEEFRMLWAKHKDKEKDTSISGFHFSLAKVAAIAGWSNQEITDLLINWNRRHELPMTKILSRPDYMARTIGNARKDASGFLSERYLQEIESVKGTEFEESLRTVDKKKAKEAASNLVGFKIYGIWNYKGEKKNRYIMRTEKGDITIHGNDINSRIKFQNAIMKETNISLSMSIKNFEKLKGLYQLLIIDVPVTEENTLEGRMKLWIIEYLQNQPHRDKDEAYSGKKPFVYNGLWHINGTSFKEWAYRNKHDQDNKAETEKDFTVIGAVSKKFNMKDKVNKRVQMRAWIIPKSIIEPVVEEKDE